MRTAIASCSADSADHRRRPRRPPHAEEEEQSPVDDDDHHHYHYFVAAAAAVAVADCRPHRCGGEEEGGRCFSRFCWDRPHIAAQVACCGGSRPRPSRRPLMTHASTARRSMARYNQMSYAASPPATTGFAALVAAATGGGGCRSAAARAVTEAAEEEAEQEWSGAPRRSSAASPHSMRPRTRQAMCPSAREPGPPASACERRHAFSERVRPLLTPRMLHSLRSRQVTMYDTGDARQVREAVEHDQRRWVMRSRGSKALVASACASRNGRSSGARSKLRAQERDRLSEAGAGAKTAGLIAPERRQRPRGRIPGDGEVTPMRDIPVGAAIGLGKS